MAVGLAGLALAAAASIQHYLGQTPYFVFLPAIMAAAWYGGSRSGLVATLTSLVLIDILVIEPRFTVARGWHDFVLLGLFSLVAVSTSILTAGRRQADVEREAALREAEAARQEAEQSGRIKDQFLATLSHELRTPLNAVLGWASVLVSGQIAADNVPAALASIQRNAQAQKQLVDDLLDTSAIVSGRLRLEPAPIDLADVARSAIDVVRLSIESRGQRLDEHIESVRTVGDATRLRQVVWNLLTNAVKFTPEGGAIKIRVEGGDQEARITVGDNGRGIAADFLPHVFDPFRQADSSITRVSGGLGLGLALVRHLVEAHGGRVWVESDGAGLGATFTACLPIRHTVGSNEAGTLPATAPCEPPAGAVEPPMETRETFANADGLS